MLRALVKVSVWTLVGVAAPGPAAAQDIVLRASDVRTMRGNWSIESSSSAAGGRYVSSLDEGRSIVDSGPASQPESYFEFTFDAPADTPYHVWLRLKATDDSKYNDSVWVQYSDALDAGGGPVYRIGTTSALTVNLERCRGCGNSGWGWQDDAYWLTQKTTLRFASSGQHTLRIQTREDGVGIDQVVLSPAAYLFAAPGDLAEDSSVIPVASAEATASGAYLGSPVVLPGHIKAENFDAGADGVAYHDSTSGNTGGKYRQTNVDIQTCTAGGYNIAWTEPGEWLNYSVSPSAAGSYIVKLRVASPGGGSMHVGFNAASHVWKSVSIPATGGWQSWTTVSLPVTLGAGSQLMTLLFDTDGINLDYIDVVGSTATSAPSTVGSTVTVATWNIKVTDSSASHARGAIARLMALSPRPQIVVIQEARRTQYNTYISELQARTGVTWRGVFGNHCPAGAWTGSSCSSSEDEGVAAFTSLPVAGSATKHLPYADQWHSARALVRLALKVNGVVLQVLGTHLPVSVSARRSSMAAIKSYASAYSKPQLLAGDLNAGMDEIDSTSGLLPNFVDSWKLVGTGSGHTCATPSPTMKLDYWLADAGGRAKARSTRVATTPGTYSDHYPVVAQYLVQ